MSQRDDLPGDVGDDIEKFKRMRRRDGNRSAGAWVETIFIGLFGVVAIAWLASMLLVPDTIDGRTWLGVGGLGGLLTGAPAGLIYWGRRGGVRAMQAALRGYLK